MKKCKQCKGRGKLYASTDNPKCRECNGTGKFINKKKPKNHIDSVTAKLISGESTKKYKGWSIRKLERYIQRTVYDK